ncbi:ycf3-interacting protein 1, chloroplastic [Rutidosis leptorrhynchoides]|uniref:ycf3-interacting protein 1, chloroplastic n=1 Tax=Rutidosis leptorrhynchoides TaxID=125765 RepID=UPI003A98DECE
MSLLKLSTQLSLPLNTLLSSSSSQSTHNFSVSFPKHYLHHRIIIKRTKLVSVVVSASNEDTKTELSVAADPNTIIQEKEEEDDDDDVDDEFEDDPDPQDLEYVSQIKKVLELLKKNRDMLFSEVKLTVMIEDPREVERKRLIGIDDADTPTREELADILQEVYDGKIPRDRAALQMLAEEMVQWPNLEVEATKKGPKKSLYAKATDTGIDPQVAAKRLNIDWDSAAEIEEEDRSDETEVPSLVGYGALYLVTAFPVIIGISVVLILFYNSLQ